MPGVPSGRGCEACRAQKKKCDETKPACSRCARLQIPCVGAGKQRYKFKEQTNFPNAAKSAQLGNGLRGHETGFTAQVVCREPSNDVSVIINAFTQTIKPSTDMRFNLSYSFGAFMYLIPARIGINEALDMSTTALVDAHANFCSKQGASADTLIKYSRALRTLKNCLDDPVKACASETLCAVMLLLICQSFIGATDQWWTGHCEGAVQILKARRFYNAEDEFESKLLLSLRGPLLFEGILNERIKLSRAEWDKLILNELDRHLDQISCEGRMMRCLSKMPSFIERGRIVLNQQGNDLGLIHEMRENRRALAVVIKELRDRLALVEARITEEPKAVYNLTQTHARFLSTYGLGLTIGIIINCVLSALDTENADINTESMLFSNRLITLSEDAVKYGPLGNTVMPLCLFAAWVGTTDCDIRSSAQRALLKHNVHGVKQDIKSLVLDLERVARQLRLQDTSYSTSI